MRLGIYEGLFDLKKNIFQWAYCDREYLQTVGSVGTWLHLENQFCVGLLVLFCRLHRGIICLQRGTLCQRSSCIVPQQSEVHTNWQPFVSSPRVQSVQWVVLMDRRALTEDLPLMALQGPLDPLHQWDPTTPGPTTRAPQDLSKTGFVSLTTSSDTPV